MTRTQQAIQIENGTRYIATLRFPVGDNPETSKHYLLKEFMEGFTSGLSYCGTVGFQKMRMFQDSGNWVIEMTSEEYR